MEDNLIEKDLILNAKGVKKYFPIQSSFLKRTVGYVKAVDHVDISIYEGKTFGLVGESGCGKTTFGRCLLRAIEPTAGSIRFRTSDGDMKEIVGMDKGDLRRIRRDMQMIFQDPYSSLNPWMIVRDIVGEPLKRNNICGGKALAARVMELMELVSLDPRHLKRYPHAFSGGQRQRIGIARALATNPRLIVCDEAVSALDVSVQAQIINLLQKLQTLLNLSYLFISHDLSVIQHISDQVGVMYVGKVVELAASDALFARPLHPYTEALLSAKPIPDPRLRADKILIEGEIASPANPPQGCYFHPRCKYVKPMCAQAYPEFREIESGHFAACHRAEDLSLKGVYRL